MNPVRPARPITNQDSRDLHYHLDHLARMSVRAPPRTVAVLGGGISGLTAAFALSRTLPEHKVVVLEGNDRLGGWVRSKRIRVHDPHVNNDATALLESGPRSLMPGKYKGLRTLEMVRGRSHHSSLSLVWRSVCFSSRARPSPPRIASSITADG